MRRVIQRVRFAVSASQVRGQGRPRFAIVGGRPSAYKAAEDKAWEETIKRAYLANAGASMAGFADEVHVRIEVSRRLPKTAPKRVDAKPDTSRPDADNYAKACLDALNRVAWRDDSQVTRLTVEKMPRTRRDDELMTVEIEYVSEMGERNA